MHHPVDAVMLAQRAASFTRRSIKAESKNMGLRLAVSMVDLTTLEGADSPELARALCRRAISPAPSPIDPPVPSVAAVCVYPRLVPIVREALVGSSVKTASVATSFPSGQIPLDTRLRETEAALAAGADEIDMVISRGAFLAGRFEEVAAEIRAVQDVCGETHLKIILETGELKRRTIFAGVQILRSRLRPSGAKLQMVQSLSRLRPVKFPPPRPCHQSYFCWRLCAITSATPAFGLASSLRAAFVSRRLLSTCL
ncbi:MAG: hypothetical protein P8I91_08960 [Phycisphaerales bacterium]|nr:hypothetical protein [Phycisphaerales bacterium]